MNRMNNASDLRTGALLGLLSTAALAGLLYLFAQAQILSFVPLDIADAAIQLTPGQFATQGIEALGPGAKMLLEIIAILLFLLVGTFAGVLIVRLRAYRDMANGLLVGLGGLILTVSVQALAGRFPDVITLGSTAVLLFSWSFSLLWLLKQCVAMGTGQQVEQPGRRLFLQRSGGLLLTLAIGGTAVGELLRRAAEDQIAQEIAKGGAVALPGAPLPVAGSKATEPGAGVGVLADPAFSPGVGMRPEMTPSDKLYVVSSSIRPPQVHVSSWSLTIKGLVERPLTLSYEELRALPRVDQTSTLTCISNVVGGALTGNITWTGTRLSDLLRMAGLKPGAVDVVLRSVEGYSDSIPLDRALSPEPLIVYGMNGTTLTTEHGFPARLIVPGIYGMKNVKWLNEIDVVGQDYQGFWQQRGWSDTALVKTQSTVDTGNPELGNDPHATLESGSLILAGYAFAGDRGISKVEVQVDGGEWQSAQLKKVVSKLVWQPWRYEWRGTPGQHTVTVRATDGADQLQTAERAAPHPDGASGWHTVEITLAL